MYILKKFEVFIQKQIKIGVMKLINKITKVLDNVFNPVSGIASDEDVSTGFQVSTQRTNIDDALAAKLYIENRLIQKIIDLIPESAATAKLTITGDSSKDANTKFDQIFKSFDLIPKFVQASISARIFKESYLWIQTNNEDVNQPFQNEQILGLELFEIDQLYPIFNQNYTERIGYKLISVTGDPDDDIVIHPSRILLFVGKHLSLKAQSANNFYHASILQGLIDSFIDLKGAMKISFSLLSRLVTFVYKQQNLGSVIEEDGEAAIIQRLKVHRKSIGSVGGLIIDKEAEDVDWLTINLAGVSETINQIKQYFSAESDLTHDILWNEGSHDTASMIEDANQRKKVNNFINTHWLANLQVLVKYINPSQDLNIEFQLDEDVDTTTLLQNRDTQSRIDSTYLNSGVLSAEEIRVSRFLDSYSHETQVKGTTPPKLETETETRPKKVEDANYKRKADFTLTKGDVEDILTDLVDRNPFLFQLINSEFEPEETESSNV